MKTKLIKHGFFVCLALVISIVLFVPYVLYIQDSYFTSKQNQFLTFKHLLKEKENNMYALAEYIDRRGIHKQLFYPEKALLVADKGLFYPEDIDSISSENRYIMHLFIELHQMLPSMLLSDEFVYFQSFKNFFILTNKEFSTQWLQEKKDHSICESFYFCGQHYPTPNSKTHISFEPLAKDKSHYIWRISALIFEKTQLIGKIETEILFSRYDFATHKKIDIQKSNDGSSDQLIILREPNEWLIEKGLYTVKAKIKGNYTLIYQIATSKIIEDSAIIFLGLLCLLYMSILIIKYVSDKKEENLQEIKREAQQDPLTGLFNRKIFLSPCFKQATTKATCVISIDGNRLKGLNDKYGHKIGDEAIIHIAQSMQATFRKTDYLIRTGGDEFIAVLPCCQYEVAERLAAKLARTIIRNPLSCNESFSISYGVAESEEKTTLEECIALADERLYQHKNANRSTVSNNTQAYL